MSRPMWQSPWGYKESTAIVAGITAVGLALQSTVGSFDPGILRSPGNLIAGGVLLLAALFAGVRRHSPFCRWLSGIELAAALIGMLVLLGIVMGLTPQSLPGSEPSGGTVSTLGFDRMTASWPFALLYSILLLSLGALIVRRLRTFRWRDYAFYLNHAGLWLVLFAAGFGAADMKRYVMHVREGETEWRVYNDKGAVLDLPIAISLKDFRMEEYPPKLAVIDRATGEALPSGKPHYFQLDPKEPDGRIGDWTIRLDTYIHDAVRNSDSTYRETPMPGATPAARITVQDAATGAAHTGWVCAGNMAQLYKVLNLDEQHAVVMTQPEPRRFASDIEVYTEDGRTAQTVLEVNHPLRLGRWTVYQYDYDKQAGRMSSWAGFELVYDPWLRPVYAGLVLLMAGSVCMLWGGRKRKEANNDVE